jgi:hypothetical protein
MIKHILRSLSVVAVMLTLSITTFTGGKAQAAPSVMQIDQCKNKTLSVQTRNSELVCTRMLQELMNMAHVMYVGWGHHPGWPFVTVDGDFYTQTRQAVLAYQLTLKSKGANITVDGVVRPQTWNFIIWDCGVIWPSRGVQSVWCAPGAS